MRGSPRRVDLRLLLLMLALVPVVAGAAVRDLDQVWLLSGAEILPWLAGHEGTAGMPATGLAWGQGRLFGLSDLAQVGVAAHLGWGSWAARGSWQQLGPGPYREQTLGLELLRQGAWVWGGRLVRIQQGFQGRDPLAASHGQLMFGRRWEFPAAGDLVLMGFANLGTWIGAAPRRLLHLKFRLRELAAGMNVERNAMGEPSLDVDAYWRLAPGVALELRLDPASGALGPGLHLRRGGFLLRTSHLVHPRLGQTHRFGCYWGWGHG